MIAAGAYWFKVLGYALVDKAILHSLLDQPSRRELEQPLDGDFSLIYQKLHKTIMMFAGNGSCKLVYPN